GALHITQRSAERARREFGELRQLRGGRGLELALERLGPLAERLAHVLVEDDQFLRLVLRHEANEHRQILVLRDRPLRDKAMFRPEPVEPARLLVVEEEAGERLVVAVEELQADDLVGWDDLREADECREDAAEVVEALEQPLARCGRAGERALAVPWRVRAEV